MRAPHRGSLVMPRRWTSGQCGSFRRTMIFNFGAVIVSRAEARRPGADQIGSFGHHIWKKLRLCNSVSSPPNPILITHLADLSVCEVDLKHVFR